MVDIQEFGFVLDITGSSFLVLRNDIAGSNAYFFNRSFAQFGQEFGNPTSQYWIGFDRLYNISQCRCTIRFDLNVVGGSSYYAQYSNFLVGSFSTAYTLTISGYSGNLADAMAWHNGRQFSTYDHDTSPGGCTKQWWGAFWYNACYYAGITTSPASNFRWFAPSWSNSWQLSSVEVRLLC